MYTIKEADVFNKKFLNQFVGTVAAAGFLLAFTPHAGADHWASSVVPPHGEEAITWCGAAVAQMIMEGYPAGGCTNSQTSISTKILSNKTETMWDADPAGLRGAMLEICPPVGTWSIHHNTDPTVVMHAAAKWMTRNSYPVAILLNTSSHNAYTMHQEHWAVIQSIKTDLDPTTSPTVTLKNVVIVDPVVPFTSTPAAEWISGTEWYGSKFQPVSKTGSSYANEYVAIIEPPKVTGIAVAPLDILTGRLINIRDIIEYVLKDLRKEGLYEMDGFIGLEKLKPAGPMLVNGSFGGYYLIPFTKDGSDGGAGAAVLVNAYTGSLKSVKTYRKPVKFLTKHEAIEIGIGYLNERVEVARAELVYQAGETESKFFPIWRVFANKKAVRVNMFGKVVTRAFRDEYSLPLPGPDPQGIAWDGKLLLIVDGKTRTLYKINPNTGRVHESFELSLKKPKGLAYDGELLWVADEGTRKIHSINPNNGQIIKTISMEIAKERGFKSFEGLTWDGQYLWTAYFAGFSSTFNKVDTHTGETVRSVFANSHPSGIASDGKYIWSICYNGKKLPSKIARVKIMEKEHEMLASRAFIKDIESGSPSGLEYAGNNLWYVDKELKKVFRIRVRKEEK